VNDGDTLLHDLNIIKLPVAQYSMVVVVAAAIVALM